MLNVFAVSNYNMNKLLTGAPTKENDKEREKMKKYKYVACASEKYPVDVSYFHTFHSIASESDVPVGELAQCVFGDRENMVVYCNGQLSICITIKSITTIIYCTKYIESTVQL